ncbi:hypothetical protein DXN05_03540 [Deminuibacter soli]|uniref:Uncharacterized protein n=1 Tax=Deminuibacter soli TaxID=2291815 RepID=A0A3E1NQI6_9BACT|nr:hypothetical protein DXN05_03540 [Deminuibacter soli]
MMYLAVTIKSFCSSRVYGIAGTQVTVKRMDSDGVAIVEDGNGFRFTCRAEHLVNHCPATVPDRLPDPTPVRNAAPARAGTKRPQPIPSNQCSLF